MTAQATPPAAGQPDRTRTELVTVLRDRLDQEKRRYVDATLDVRIATERWARHPTEEHRLVLVDELTVGLCLGRNHLLCLDDLGRALDPAVSATELDVVVAAKEDVQGWLTRCGEQLRRLFEPAPPPRSHPR